MKSAPSITICTARIRSASRRETVEVERPRHVLGVDGEAFLGASGAGVADRQDRDVGLVSAVLARCDVDEGLVVQKLGASFAVNWASRRILMRLVEATALADSSSTSEDLGCAVAEVLVDGRLQLRGDLLARVRRARVAASA